MAAAYEAAKERQEAKDEQRRTFIRSDTGKFARKVNAVASKPFEKQPPDRHENYPQGATEKKYPEDPQLRTIRESMEAGSVRQAPISWPKEHHAEFAKLSPAAQELVERREREAHQKITELGQSAREIQPLREISERFKGSLGGMATVEAYEKLAAANDFLHRDPVAGIQWLAAAYGIDLNSLTGQPLHHEHPHDNQDAKALVDHFAASKADWAELEADIFEQVHAIKSADPHLPGFAVLEKAYERAARLNTNVSQRRSQMERVEADKKARADAAKRAAAARKSASINVRSTVGASPKPSGSWEQTMREVGDRLMR